MPRFGTEHLRGSFSEKFAGSEIERTMTMETKILGTTTEEIDQAAQILSAGGLVAFPTETVYGLGADALNEKAVAKVYAAKGRPSDNPMIVHISSKDDLSMLTVEITEDMEKGQEKRGIKVKAGQPANFYCISCVPWAAFTAFGSRTVNSTELMYFPIITMGKYEKSGDRILMPVNLMIAHAVADGYHAGMFFQRLQEAVDRLSVRNQDPE